MFASSSHSPLRLLHTSRRSLHTTPRLLTSNRLPASYYRGGTSRALFFHINDLPKDKSQWSSIFLGTLGSPDPYGRQLDGMGGGISSLSKICVVGPPTKEGADVDYTFAAVGVKDTQVDFAGNCGNMISAVGPFAVDTKLFTAQCNDASSPQQTIVRIHNTNTGKIIHSIFSLTPDLAEFEPRGSFSIDGVAGTASPIQLDFIDPVGSRTGKLLPTGHIIDTFDGTRTSCIDVANPACFVQASELGLSSTNALSPAQIETHPTLLKQLESIRRQAAVKMGLGKTLQDVPGSVPKICMVWPPPTGSDTDAVDLQVRAISVGQPHKAVPITVALATAAAARLKGSVVSKCVRHTENEDRDGVTIAHASGTLRVGAKFVEGEGETRKLEYATVFRTARRLMEGTVFWK